MLTHPTLDQMQALGLAGMAAAYRQLAEQDNAADLSREEWLGLMLDREAATRADKRLTNRLAAAKLRFVDACIEDIDFATLQLAQGAWLKAHENLIVTGRTGTGKTWLACAFGRQPTTSIANPARQSSRHPRSLRLRNLTSSDGAIATGVSLERGRMVA